MTKSTLMYAGIAALIVCAMAIAKYQFGLAGDELRWVQVSTTMWMLLWLGCQAAYRKDSER